MSHRRRKLIIFLALFVGIPTLSFFTSRYGYCQSWWGKDNLLFRSWWLCHCPDGFEQTLYPPYAEVMYSACNRTGVGSLTDQRYLRVKEEVDGLESDIYILDLATLNRIPFKSPEPTLLYKHLLHEWLLVFPASQGGDGLDGYSLYHWPSSTSIPIVEISEETISVLLAEDSLHPNVVSLFYDKEQIIVVDNFRQVVVLASDWEQGNSESFIIDVHSQLQPDSLLNVILASGIPYTEATLNPPATNMGLTSPDGEWIATPNGIYNADSEQLIVPISFLDFPSIQQLYCTNPDKCGVRFEPCCWWPDSQSVIYRFDFDRNSFPSLSRFQIGSPSGNVHEGFGMPIFRVHLP